MPDTPSKPDQASDQTDVSIRAISNLYESVANGAPYEPIFYAMDEVIDNILVEPEPEVPLQSIRSVFLKHFDHAAQVFDIVSRQKQETPLQFVEQKAQPAVVMDLSGKVIAANALFEALVGAAGLADLFATARWGAVWGSGAVE